MLPKYLLSSLVLVFSASALGTPVLSHAQTQLPNWTKAAPPTVARQELYPEVLNGKIYVVGGLLSPNTGFSAHPKQAEMQLQRSTKCWYCPLSEHIFLNKLKSQ
jgi:hypothetical protein